MHPICYLKNIYYKLPSKNHQKNTKKSEKKSPPNFRPLQNLPKQIKQKKNQRQNDILRQLIQLNQKDRLNLLIKYFILRYPYQYYLSLFIIFVILFILYKQGGTTMQNSFKNHRINEKLMILLRDCLNDNKNENDMTHLQFIIKRSTNNTSELHLLDSQYKNISEIIDINYLSNRKCYRWIDKEKHSFFIYIGKSEIISYRINQSQQKNKEIQIFCTSPLLKLDRSVEFVYLSREFQLESSINMIGYTSDNKFYLIQLNLENPLKFSFEIIKLNDLDKSSRFFSFSWFSKQKVQTFNSIALEWVKQGANDNKNFCLCVRDNLLSILEISIDKDLTRSTIKTVVNQQINLSERYQIKQILVYQEDSYKNQAKRYLLTYQSPDEKKVKILSVEIDENMKLIIRHLKYEFNSVQFSANVCHNHLYITGVQSQKLNRICYRFALSNLQEQLSKNTQTGGQVKHTNISISEVEPYFIRNHKIQLVGNHVDLYLVQPTSVSLIESDQLEIDNGSSQQELKYLIMKKSINRNLINKMKISFKRGKIHEILPLLNEKINKILQWRVQCKKFYKQIEKPVNLQLIQDLICTQIIKIIFDKKILFSHLANNYKGYNHHQTYSQEYSLLLQNGLYLTNIPNLTKIIDYLCNFKAQKEFIHIIEHIKSLSNLQSPKEIQQVNITLFQEGFINILSSMRQQDVSKSYRIILQYSFSFGNIEQKKLMNDIKKLIRYNYTQEVENMILNHNLDQCFVQFFAEENIWFQHQDVRKFVDNMGDKGLFKRFIEGLFKKCKETYGKHKMERKKGIFSKMQVLIKGLSHRIIDFQDILNNYFPSLAPLFYLKSNLRMQRKQVILGIAQNYINPELSTILFHSVLQKDDKNTQKMIKIAQFCTENKMKYIDEDKLLSDIQSQFAKSKYISQISKESFHKLKSSIALDKTRQQKICKNMDQYEKQYLKNLLPGTN